MDVLTDLQRHVDANFIVSRDQSIQHGGQSTWCHRRYITQQLVTTQIMSVREVLVLEGDVPGLPGSGNSGPIAPDN